MAGSSKDTTVIFIAPQRIQKTRYQMMVKATKKKGFNIVDSYSDDVTHIVTECESIDQLNTVLSIENLPGSITVLNTQWISECLRSGHLVKCTDMYILKKDIQEEQEPASQKSNMTEYACMRSTPLDHPNKVFTEALEILEKQAQLRDGPSDYSRALAFRRGSCCLKSLPKKLTSIHDVSGLKDIGNHCRSVIKDILDCGFSHEATDIKADMWYKKMCLFTGVFGIGTSKAKKWINKGLLTIDDAIADVTKSQSSDQRVCYGLAYYDDLNNQVSMEEAQRIEEIINTIAVGILPGVTVTMTGGFRRGKKLGHDCDLLLTHPVEKNVEGLLTKILAELIKQGYVLMGNHEKSSYREEKLYTDDKLSAKGQLDHFEKWMGIMKLPKPVERAPRKKPRMSSDLNNEGSNSTTKTGCLMSEVLSVSRQDNDWTARRVDLIVSPASQFYYALVGWTGNKHFNRSLRLYAQRELNMKLTSHGLYDLVKHKSIPASSEEQVFHNLRIPYRKPTERNC